MIDNSSIMTEMKFYKFNGAGNDFVVVDCRREQYPLTEHTIAHLCHRRFGIGADGLMTLGVAPEGYDFEMRYYNSDGRLGSMCGNGGRCISAFAHLLGLSHPHPTTGSPCLHFVAYDGDHDAQIISWDNERRRGVVRLGMRTIDRSTVCRCEQGWFLDTGSPHFVMEVDNLNDYDVEAEGRRWRNRLDLFPEGTNVDFIERQPDGALAIRTFERGVEAETWACGTGVTAVAIVSGCKNIHARGGDFEVSFSTTDKAFDNVLLTGPVSLDFEGIVTI